MYEAGDRNQPKRGKLYPCIISKNDKMINFIESGTARVDEDGNIIEVQGADGFSLDWQGYDVEVIK